MKTRREFLQQSAVTSAGLMLSAANRSTAQQPATAGAASRPNIILILADDMGFSDIGCYGSEIDTPNLNRLAAGGLRFTQFYNCPRCCPSRAALLTGLYSHQAGMGMMTEDYRRYPYPGYAGDLSQTCVTIAEALKAAGYRTAMAGKWHLTPTEGVDKHNWPLQRGFEKYFGTIAGAGSYYDPVTLTKDNTPVKPEKDFFYTDAIAEHAAQYVEEFAASGSPFFLYSAFTAGHWPLHALEQDIEKYKDRYRGGWDQLRLERHKRQLEMGLVQEKWGLTPRDPRVPPWEMASFKEWEMRRMAVYAAQLDRLDRGIGKILAKLEQHGAADNTLVLFMADNGGNYEEMAVAAPASDRPLFIPRQTLDGRVVRRGNTPDIMPGGPDTYQSYGIPWGNCSNTPFRLYKHFAHEGGISTPLIAHWPRMIKREKALTTQIGHEVDIMPTCLEIAGAQYPAKTAAGSTPTALVGQSLVPIFQGGTRERGPIFWEHEGNCALRDGRWKLVSQFPDYWELYDMEEDRTEMHNLADRQMSRVKQMAAAYRDWTKLAGVQPWPMPQTPQNQRQGVLPAPDYLRKDRS